MKVARARIIIFVAVAVSFMQTQLCSSALADQATPPAKTVASGAGASPTIKATVTQTGDGAGPSEVEPMDPSLLKNIQLWMIMRWSPTMFDTQANPVLGGVASQLPKYESQQLVSQMMKSKDVSNRVTDWKIWYQRLFTVATNAAGNKGPDQSLMFSIPVTVTNQRKIMASLDQFSNRNGASPLGREYAQKIADALNGLNGTDKLAFPSESTLSEVHFSIHTNGFGQLELNAIGNGLQ